MGRDKLGEPSKIISRATLVTLFALLVSCLWPATSVSAAGLESYRLATGFYQRKKWELSIKEFRTFLKDLPDHPKAEKAEVYLGMALVNLQNFSEARDVFREFVKRYTESQYLSHAMYRTGECSYLLNDLEAADAELSRFLNQFPEDGLASRARFNLAETKSASGKADEAVELFQKVIQDNPQGTLNAPARFGLAKAYTKLNKNDEAEKIYTELVRDLPERAAVEARLQLADLIFDRGDFKTAAAKYAEIETAAPNSPLLPGIQLKLGKSLYGARQYREAAERLRPLIQDERYGVDAEFWLGVSLKSLRQFGEAAAILKANSARQGDSPGAPRTLYQWADCERLAENYSEASKLFLELVSRWPEDSLADDALHAAGLSMFKTGNLQETQLLTDRFSKEYPTSGLRLRQELLEGRLDLALARASTGEAAKKSFQSAAQKFRNVLEKSSIEATQSRARYFLAFASYELGNYQEALTEITPLINSIDEEEQKTDSAYTDSHVLQALCLLKLKRHNEAAHAATVYLELDPDGEFAAQALGIRARAAAMEGNKEIARNDQEKLSKQWPKTEEFARTTEELADIAYANQDFTWSAKLYGQLAALDKDSPYRPTGLSNLGWALYQLKEYKQAAETFAKFVEDYPKHRLAADAGFKQGASLRELGDIEAAAEVLLRVFETYAPDDKAFTAGLSAARQLRALNKIEEAEKVYASLAKTYPDRDDLTLLLNEWAVMHHTTEDFERRDLLYQRIVNEFPNSPQADDARLGLAISDMIAGELEKARPKLEALRAKTDAADNVREEAIYRLTELEVSRQEWKQVKTLSEQSLENFPEGIRVWDARFRLAQADYELHDFESALPQLTKLKQARGEPVDPNADMSDEVETVGHLEWFPSVWILLAEIEFRNKDYTGVASTVDDFAKTSPESPYLYVAEEVLGRSLKAQGRFAEARKVFERITQDKSGRQTETAAKCRLMIAETYFMEKEYSKAIEEYLKVDILYDFPQWQAPAILAAGMCEEKSDHWKKAAALYEDLIERFPKSTFAEDAKKRLTEARKKASR